MIRRPPRSTLFPYTTLLPISGGRAVGEAPLEEAGRDPDAALKRQQAADVGQRVDGHVVLRRPAVLDLLDVEARPRPGLELLDALGLVGLADLVRLAAGDHELAVGRGVRADGVRRALGREVHALRRLRARAQTEAEGVGAL